MNLEKKNRTKQVFIHPKKVTNALVVGDCAVKLLRRRNEGCQQFSSQSD